MKQNIIPILMPKWGLTMEEGQVNEWLVKEGAEISVGDEIIEVETDKISGAVLRRMPLDAGGRALPILSGWVKERSAPESSAKSFMQQWKEGIE